LKKEKTTDYWLLIFILVPAILFGKIGNILNDKNIAYSVGFTILGVGLGFLLHFLTKNKSIITKLVAIIILISIPFGLMIVNSKNNNSTKNEWINQKISNIEFLSPYNLELIQSEIPENLKEHYTRLEVYSDGKNDKSTTVYSIELKDDNIDLENYFKQYLESIESKIPSLERTEIIEQTNNENGISTTFRFILKDKSIDGFCKLTQDKKEISMLWLIPLTKGFSKEHIDKFNKSITN